MATLITVLLALFNALVQPSATQKPAAPTYKVVGYYADWTAERYGARLLTQTGIIVPRGTVTHALAIGIDDTTRPPFAHPVAGLEMSHSFPLGGGRQNFFDRRSFNAAWSSIASARSRLSFAFSLSSSFSRRASETSIPPKRAFQL